MHIFQGRPQDLAGERAKNFFFRFGNLHVAKRHAAHGEAMRFARGVSGVAGGGRGGQLPPGAARRGAPKSCQRIFKK